MQIMGSFIEVFFYKEVFQGGKFYIVYFYEIKDGTDINCSGAGNTATELHKIAKYYL